MSKIHEALKKAQSELKSPPPVVEQVEHMEVALPLADSVALTPPLDATVANMSKGPWVPQNPDLLLYGNNRDFVHLEAFRKLCSQLYLYGQTRLLKTVLLTSAIPGEGKTFVTANLGITLARQKGKKILLVDGDLRQGTLARLLGARPGPGLVEYLKGQVALEKIVQRGPVGDLYFISAGGVTDHAAELLRGNALRMAMSQLTKVFDWILVDSPPALPVSDVSALGLVADAVLVVARAAMTDRDLVRKVRDMFPERVLGIALNGVRRGDVYSAYEYPSYLKSSLN